MAQKGVPAFSPVMLDEEALKMTTQMAKQVAGLIEEALEQKIDLAASLVEVLETMEITAYSLLGLVGALAEEYGSNLPAEFFCLSCKEFRSYVERHRLEEGLCARCSLEIRSQVSSWPPCAQAA